MFVYNDNLRVNIIQCWHCLLKWQVQWKIISNVGRVKSFVDDLKWTGYCKRESSLCATIRWGSAFVQWFVQEYMQKSITLACIVPLPYLSPPSYKKHNSPQNPPQSDKLVSKLCPCRDPAWTWLWRWLLNPHHLDGVGVYHSNPCPPGRHDNGNLN